MLDNESQKKNQKEKVSNHYVKTGLVFVICFEIIMLFMYGFYTSYTSSAPDITRLEFILTNSLAVLGFGLLLVYFKYTIKQTLIIALIICGVNVQMGPLMQQFWTNVFLSNFDNKSYNSVSINLAFVRISTYCSISLLVALSGVIGRIGVFNTLLTSFNLNYYLNYLIFAKNAVLSQSYYIMDDFQGSRVFMFGAGFGLPLLLLYNKFQPIDRQKQAQYTDSLSSFLTLLGTAFVISLFYFVLDSQTLQSKEYALLNIYFAFSGSIVSSIAISCIIDGVITFHTVNMGIISGVIQISIIGGFIKTPYVSLLVGAFAGIVTSLLLHFVQKRINNKKFRDIKGVIVIYLINSFLCSYFISPIIIKAYKNVDSSITQNQGYHMIYTSISLGIGLVAGFIAGLFRKCFKQDIQFKDLQFFNRTFLLHRQIPTQSQPQKKRHPISLIKQEVPSQYTLIGQQKQQKALSILF